MKRLFDLVVSLSLLLLLAPILILIACASLIILGRPILFRQTRPGRDGKLFRMVKFRTMSDARGADGRLLDDGERLGRYGQFLRGWSLDELPELWNVLRGEMSLVGPRPLLVQYLDIYTDEQKRRHEVRPGLTGWAQVNGRNAMSWDQKFACDIWYVDNHSFALDLKILALTALKLLQREGISADGHTSMPIYTGSGTPPAASPEADEPAPPARRR